MKNIKNFKNFINESNSNESVSQDDFPKLLDFLESNIPPNKGIQLFPEGNRILIGYFPSPAFMSDLSKTLPEKVLNKLEDKYLKTSITVIANFEKLDPLSGKKMNFTSLSLPSLASSEFKKEIESVF